MSYIPKYFCILLCILYVVNTYCGIDAYKPYPDTAHVTITKVLSAEELKEFRKKQQELKRIAKRKQLRMLRQQQQNQNNNMQSTSQ